MGPWPAAMACLSLQQPLDREGSGFRTADGIARYRSRFTMLYSSFKFRNLEPMSDSTSRFGFVAFAETWNGRLAMLGFTIGLATELLTGQGILGQLGLG